MPNRLVAEPFALFAIFALFVSAPGPARSETTPAWPSAQWPRSSPEAQGMSSVELAAMLERIAGGNPGLRSVTLVRHGTVVLDAPISPSGPGDRHDIHSCTKSVLSALVGIAIDRGDLPGLDTPVLDFFPGYEIENLDDGKRAMTLRHLLTMSAGLETEDSYLYDWAGLRRMRASTDWARYILNLPMVDEPGARFEYSNCVSQLIAVILQEATGRSAEAYAREHLFGPIGIADYAWEGSKPGTNLGFSGLSLHPLDMARIGYLYLRDGEWNGESVVTAGWVKESTSPQITAGTLAQSYGYQWWVDDDMFMMQGYGGQFVYVLPALDLVAVFTGALPEERFYTARSLLANYIEAAVTADHALPANPAATARLDSLVEVLGHGSPEPPQPAPELVKSVSGRTFEFAENNMGLRSIALHFTPGASEARIEFAVGPMAASLTIGLDGIYRVSDLYGQRWACRGRWVDDERFVLEEELIGKVLRRRITLDFRGDTLDVDIHDLITNTFNAFSASLAQRD